MPSQDMAVPTGLIMELIGMEENSSDLTIPYAVAYREGCSLQKKFLICSGKNSGMFIGPEK